MNKEDFNKVWKDSSREAILNQYYYDYIELRKVYSIIKEVREYIDNDFNRFDCSGSMAVAMEMNHKREELLEILDKVGEDK